MGDMTAIDRARALLAAAEQRRCGNPRCIAHCRYPDILRGYIGAAEAQGKAERLHVELQTCHECTPVLFCEQHATMNQEAIHERRKALAEFEKLFGEEGT